MKFSNKAPGYLIDRTLLFIYCCFGFDR